jgi:hypothetical protein
MNITLTLTNDEVIALQTDLTSTSQGVKEIPDIAIVLPQLVHDQLIRPAVERQQVYAQSGRLQALQQAVVDDLAAVDAILAKYKESPVDAIIVPNVVE